MAGGKVKWCSYCQKQVGSFLKILQLPFNSRGSVPGGPCRSGDLPACLCGCEGREVLMFFTGISKLLPQQKAGLQSGGSAPPASSSLAGSGVPEAGLTQQPQVGAQQTSRLVRPRLQAGGGCVPVGQSMRTPVTTLPMACPLANSSPLREVLRWLRTPVIIHVSIPHLTEEGRSLLRSTKNLPGGLERGQHARMPSPPPALSSVLCKEDEQLSREPGPGGHRRRAEVRAGSCDNTGNGSQHTSTLPVMSASEGGVPPEVTCIPTTLGGPTVPTGVAMLCPTGPWEGVEQAGTAVARSWLPGPCPLTLSVSPAYLAGDARPAPHVSPALCPAVWVPQSGWHSGHQKPPSLRHGARHGNSPVSGPGGPGPACQKPRG